MEFRPADHCDLFQEVLDHASERAGELLATPGSAARLRQLGPDDLSEIQRLESSPLAQSQLIAVGVRLAGSRKISGDIRNQLGSYFAISASSLEIEALRRSIWKRNRALSTPSGRAEAAMLQIEQWIRQRGGTTATQMHRWAALYADLWCDPRIGATLNARRVMLEMVSLMHERAACASAIDPTGTAKL